ncbi:hypothetical protein GUITHDRAFT_164366 [Guillardia theta CCMP2712]|uniref:Uncharacterized protein n=2 Tax=Guillardia theta TaxID=55529 RepID=L1IZZ3_GUITC|nr:hypothetical protein GUITHDRAFT_164366 [Guillardia theta CCMP2712]EKX41484.1 hypothetical protein GUITHDRAFT_164366 [Guillardia theta CCMP2712]|mmetsp:Transcript_16580/g.55299  ORF Transcript_16580/g.55299 Transcript_16580/m.55299 type:complete len:150 (+) Transcript_16580:47-496(+)|eukprot:XP_005828464.1 hypothetical protein GUITHDRAFT_164366 [Guillardia theta CCMP2712]
MQQPYSYPDMSAFQPSVLPGQFPSFAQAPIQGTPIAQFPIQGAPVASFAQGAPVASYPQVLPSYGVPTIDASSYLSAPFNQPMAATTPMLPFVQSANGQPEFYLDPNQVSSGYIAEHNAIIMPKGFMTKDEYAKRRAQQEAAARAAAKA